MTPIEFFAQEAPYAFRRGEPKETACRRNAWEMACAEAAARDVGARFEWTIDPDITTADWCDDEPAHSTWVCALVMPESDGRRFILDSIGGIDLGPTGQPCTESYARVIEAQLAHTQIVTLLAWMLPEVTE